MEAVIRMTYFFLTTLSTIGFGDLHPRSDPERILMAILMLGGVAVFSYVMGNFIEILDKIIFMTHPLEEADMLSKFFGLLIRFNRNQQLDMKMKQDIETYFEFRWSNNKNWFVNDEEGRMMFDQLP